MNSWILAQLPSSSGPSPTTGTHVEGGGAATGVAGTAATNATQQDGSQPAPPPPASPPSNMMIFALGGILLVAYLFMSRGPKKEEKKRQTMLDAMKKGDEVETIGGLVGKIVEVRNDPNGKKENDRVVLKVDESANVKETYLKAAIRRVITPPEEKDTIDDKEKK